MKKYIPTSAKWFPLSSAVVHNCEYEMEISGQIGKNFETGELEQWIEAQTHRIVKEIKNTLMQVWWDLSNVIKVRIFLVDMADYEKMNDVYAQYFSWDYPARFALEVSALPSWALVEIECKAVGESISS